MQILTKMFKLTPKIDLKKGPKMCQIDLQMHFLLIQIFKNVEKLKILQKIIEMTLKGSN